MDLGHLLGVPTQQLIQAQLPAVGGYFCEDKRSDRASVAWLKAGRDDGVAAVGNAPSTRKHYSRNLFKGLTKV